MSKIEGIVNAEKPKAVKFYKYKVEVHYASERNPVMADILEHDEDADFKIIDRWTFKVKTKMPSPIMNRIAIYSKFDSVKIRKCVFF
jgi:hypothetical protein